MKRWRVKPGGPAHYVQGVGIFKSGEEFSFDADKPWSDWLEEVKPAKGKAKTGGQDEPPPPDGEPGEF